MSVPFTPSISPSNSRAKRIFPFPFNPIPRTSVKQFIELAVYIPEHDPQVGQAFSSNSLLLHALPRAADSNIVSNLAQNVRAGSGYAAPEHSRHSRTVNAHSAPGVLRQHSFFLRLRQPAQAGISCESCPSP